jgi:hypothetical protein
VAQPRRVERHEYRARPGTQLVDRSRERIDRTEVQLSSETGVQKLRVPADEQKSTPLPP